MNFRLGENEFTGVYISIKKIVEMQEALIAKYLAGESNAEETQLVESWIESLEENERIFLEFKEIWTFSKIVYHPDDIPDKALVWKNIESSIKKSKNKTNLYSRQIFVRSISIAASIALIIGFTFTSLLFSDTDETFTTITAPKGQKSMVELADGTKLWLNSGSSLTFSNKFNRKNRNVNLNGEAFFEVYKSKKNLFRVGFGDVNISVLGTKFNVKAYPQSNIAEVSLVCGSIAVNQTSINKRISCVKPNEKISIQMNNPSIYRLTQCDAETESLWHLGKLRIENETMLSAFKMMEKWYGVNISTQNIIQGKRLWFTIKTESLTEMLQIIDKITPIDYKINGEEVTIRFK